MTTQLPPMAKAVCEEFMGKAREALDDLLRLLIFAMLTPLHR
jgi:hypothetical protein